MAEMQGRRFRMKLGRLSVDTPTQMPPEAVDCHGRESREVSQGQSDEHARLPTELLHGQNTLFSLKTAAKQNSRSCTEIKLLSAVIK